MTEAIAGYKGMMLASTSSSGGTRTKVAELTDFTVMVEADEIDVTSHESSGDEEVIIGKIAWSATASAMHLQSDASQQVLFDALTNRTPVEWEFFPTGALSGGSLLGYGYVDEWDHGSPLSEALVVDVGIVGTETMRMFKGPYYPLLSSGLTLMDSTDTGLRFVLSSGLALVSSSGTYVGVIDLTTNRMHITKEV
jgi:TP901-1 family phage major tail protein